MFEKNLTSNFIAERRGRIRIGFAEKKGRIEDSRQNETKTQTSTNLLLR